MAGLELAVRQTKRYASFFHFPLDEVSLHRWLISPKTVTKESLVSLAPPLTNTEKRLIHQRALCSQAKLAKARRVARFLGVWPSIKLICATGSLAIDNARRFDDLDIMIVTGANTLWLTRPIIVFFLKIFHLRRRPSLPEHRSKIVSDKICDNLWLDETALTLPLDKRNLYTAHEVLQAKPLFDRGGVHAKFISANSWTSKYLANAYEAAIVESGAGQDKKSPARTPRYSRGELRTIFAWPNRIITALNMLAFKLQYFYMKRKITRETITLHSAYFHPNDYVSRGIIEV